LNESFTSKTPPLGKGDLVRMGGKTCPMTIERKKGKGGERKSPEGFLPGNLPNSQKAQDKYKGGEQEGRRNLTLKREEGEAGTGL